jgi:hypothetical protein
MFLIDSKTNLSFKLIIAILIISSLSLVTYINSQETQDPEKILKKSKVLACIALTKARLVQDQVIKNLYKI